MVRFFRRLRSVAKLFRFVELFVALTFLSWLSSRLPFAVRISGEYCRRFSVVILSPISIFLLGNAIVLTLLAKSGLFSSKTSSSIDNAVAEFCDELRSENHDDIDTVSDLDEEIVFQDKEIICEENTKTVNSKAVDDEYDDQMLVLSEIKKANYRRSQSENLRRESVEEEEKSERNLRRSETDICPKELAGGDEFDLFPDDDMSNEEFQRTIEAFIAKQIRFHRQERLAVVLHGKA